MFHVLCYLRTSRRTIHSIVIKFWLIIFILYDLKYFQRCDVDASLKNQHFCWFFIWTTMHFEIRCCFVILFVCHIPTSIFTHIPIKHHYNNILLLRSGARRKLKLFAKAWQCTVHWFLVQNFILHNTELIININYLTWWKVIFRMEHNICYYHISREKNKFPPNVVSCSYS